VHESGRKAPKRRPQFARLFEDANRRQFDLVLFWALDRFSREGMVQTIMHLAGSRQLRRSPANQDRQQDVPDELVVRIEVRSYRNETSRNRFHEPLLAIAPRRAPLGKYPLGE